MKWIGISSPELDVYGMNRSFERLPREVALSVSAGIADAYNAPAGGRVRFSTNSSVIALKADIISHQGIGFDMYRLEGGHELFAAGFRNPEFITEGEFIAKANVRPTPGKPVTYTLNFPYLTKLRSFAVGIDDDAELTNGERYMNEKPVVFYGSSITNGAWASRPGCTYEALISQKFNLNYTNLGFAGLAKGEESMVEYMAGLDMLAFVCDYDHNAPSAEWLERTHLPIYRTIREAHPDIPYIIVTKPDFFTNPAENAKRREVIRATYEYALSQGDANVRFIDGETLFDGDYYHNCTIDGCHPNDVGFLRMSRIIGAALSDTLDLHDTRYDLRLQ